MTITLYRYRTPPIRGSAWAFEIALNSQANPNVYQTNPTLAAGDVTVSKDGGGFNNIASLPAAIGGGATLTVSLSASEMTAERVVVLFHDAADSEWCDLLVEFFTFEAATVSDFDDTSDPVTADNAELANLDVAVSTRLATAGYTAPPTAAANADQVWDELLSGHLGAGSTGAKLNTLANAADPLLNSVPGSYAQGTAGHTLGRIGTGIITVLAPVTTEGDVTTYQGADYSVALGNEISWTDSDDDWPSALGATDVITVRVKGVSIACELDETGAHNVIRCEPTRLETAAIPAGEHAFQVVGVQTDGTTYNPLVEGTWTSKAIESGTAIS